MKFAIAAGGRINPYCSRKSRIYYLPVTFYVPEELKKINNGGNNNGTRGRELFVLKAVFFFTEKIELL